MQRQKVLGVVALSLAVANLIALPDTLNHVAIYLGYGAAIPGSINYNVVECASDGQVEGCVIRDLPSSSTYDPYRLRF
jgi:hypothetical protein